MNDAGELIKFKLPRVLKSKKRNHPFWMPGTIWDVVIQGNPKEYRVPKEMNLLFSPLPFDVHYKELKTFTDIFKLTNLLWSGEIYLKIYNLLYNFIYTWPSQQSEYGDSFVDLFYIHFLRLSGYFSTKGSCYMCQKEGELTSNYYYRFNRGKFCINCFQNYKEPDTIKIYFDSAIFSKKMSEVSSQELQNIKRSEEESTGLRANILNFLKTL